MQLTSKNKRTNTHRIPESPEIHEKNTQDPKKPSNTRIEHTGSQKALKYTNRTHRIPESPEIHE